MHFYAAIHPHQIKRNNKIINVCFAIEFKRVNYK